MPRGHSIRALIHPLARTAVVAASVLLAGTLLATLGWATAATDNSAPVAVAASSADRPDAQPTPRIVALFPFAADQLIALGVRPAAVPTLRGESPAEWADLPRVAVDHAAGPNIEQLIAAAPDIVITTSVYAQFTRQIERTTRARVIEMDIDSLDDVRRHLATLGELVGRADAARELINDLTALDTASRPDEPVVSALAIFGTPHAFYAFLPGSYLGDLVERAGGRLVNDRAESHRVFRGLAPLSMEAVIARDPNVLFVIFHGSEASARAMLDRDPLWAALSAVREGRVVFLRDDLYAMRPGSEVRRAYRRIADAIGEVRASAR